VSTILKSLKRVEKESISAQQRLMFSPSKTQTVMNHAIRFAWLKSSLFKWGIWGILLLGAVVAMYTFIRSNQVSVPQTPQKRSIDAPTSESMARVDPLPPDQGADPQKPQASNSPTFDQPAESLQEMTEDAQFANQHAPASDVLAVQSELPKLDPTATALSLPPAPARAMGNNRLRSAEVPSAAQLNAAAQSQEERQFANAERMTDGRIKIQAIVWSVIAADRMAVVNNRIVREGTALEEFSIVGISQDVLYVREAGRLLAVPFGNP